jgi:hypothetical protein
MLLPDNIHPDNSVYYNGAFVLKELQSKRGQNILELYQNVRKERKLSFSLFILCIDWLYLINVAELNENNEIELCS